MEAFKIIKLKASPNIEIRFLNDSAFHETSKDLKLYNKTYANK